MTVSISSVTAVSKCVLFTVWGAEAEGGCEGRGALVGGLGYQEECWGPAGASLPGWCV